MGAQRLALVLALACGAAAACNAQSPASLPDGGSATTSATSAASPAMSPAAAVGGPVTGFQLEKFTGTWYEVLRYPTRKQKKCVQESVILYSLGDKKGQFQVVRTCAIKDGAADVHNSNGKLADNSGTGRLKVRTIWPFWSHYAVLAVAPDYAWAVVGTSNHSSVSVLSRSVAISGQMLDLVKTQVAQAGFNAGKLVSAPPAR